MCAELDSSDEAANWAAAEPTAGHGGRLRFGGAGQQQHSHLVSDAVEDYIVSQYGVSLPGSCNRPEAAHEYMTVGIVPQWSGSQVFQCLAQTGQMVWITSALRISSALMECVRDNSAGLCLCPVWPYGF